MSDDSGWKDPFEDEDRARERETRRAEREAKRRGKKESTRQSLAERVREQLGGGRSDGDQAPPAEPVQPPAAPPAAEQSTPDPAPDGPLTPEPAALPPAEPPAAPPTADQPAVVVPPTAEHDDLGEPVDFFAGEPEPFDLPEESPRTKNAANRNRRIRRRRFAVLFIVLALLGVAAAGGYAYKHRNDNAPPPAPAPKPRKTFDVTIPEGYTRVQMAALAKKAGLKGDYMKASLKSKKIDLAKYGAKKAKNLEGFLFPATYELFKGSTAQDLVDKQVEAFRQNIGGIDMSYAKSKNLTPDDVVVIASMIQREAGQSSDFPKVGSVIYNRLKDGTPLGIDATIRYEDNNYTKPLVQSRLDEDTPYNTRTNPGLPPGPISNPGLAALKAAANPAKTDYFYYVTKPGSCGALTFAKTADQFAQATSAYNSAREAAGGKSPTTC